MKGINANPNENLGCVTFTSSDTKEEPPVEPPVELGEPCFSYKTLQKILSKISNKLNITLKTKRHNKKMIKAIHDDLGEIEFTNDHPFYYNGKIIYFEKLVQINPKFSTSRELLLEECDTLYNIIGHPDQLHSDNIFSLSDDLSMIGARCTEKINKEYFLKKKKVFENLLNSDPETIKIIKEKYNFIH